MNKILAQLRAELRAGADAVNEAGAHHYFKEEIKLYGVKNGVVRGMANKYWKDAKSLSKLEIFTLCEDLLRTITWKRHYRRGMGAQVGRNNLNCQI